MRQSPSENSEPMKQSRIEELESLAQQVRVDVLDQIYIARCGNIGGCFSSVELMIYLYEEFLKIDSDNPYWNERDRFILSKGQAAPTYYSLLAHKGFIKKDELTTFRQINSRLHTHPEFGLVPGIDFSSGSLGQGLSVGLGMALAMKKRTIPSKVVVMVGDGELQEGQVWEGVMAAGHYKLDNLILIVDENSLQDGGFTQDIMSVGPLSEKFTSFGWNVVHTDGHQFRSIENAFDSISTLDSPSCVIADTVKGKGVHFMENSPHWHMIANMSEDIYETAKKEILANAYV